MILIDSLIEASETPAGIQSFQWVQRFLDPGFHRGDDVAHYKAKDNGRNKALRFRQEMWKKEQF